MAEMAYFDTKHPVICRALCEMAKEHGWTGSMFLKGSNPDDYLLFTFCRDDTISGNDTAHGWHALTFEETVARIRRGPEKPPIVWGHLGGEKVVIRRDEIQVGGRTIEWGAVQSIYETMAKLRGAVVANPR